MTDAPIIAYKGMDQSMTCRGFQFEVGKTYEHDGEVKACESGFHACTNPQDVFTYYSPGLSRFFEVEMAGATETHRDDSKVAVQRITIRAEISLPDYIDRCIKATFAAAKRVKGQKATGYRGAASATGYRGAALASGRRGKVMGVAGCFIAAVERDADWNIVSGACGIVGRDGLKPHAWYECRDGKLVEVEA